MNTKNQNSEIIIYQTEDGLIKIEVKLTKDSVWLTQKMIAELLQSSVPNINMHIKSIYDEGELKESSTIKDFLIVQQEGNRAVAR